MCARLVYHNEDQETSPFDFHAVELARGADLRIACPYLSLAYLRRLIALAKSWLLLTDLEEWLSSIAKTERGAACQLIAENASMIRHISGLHAKVLIGEKSAMVGSANLTSSGIQCRTEMAVVLTEEGNRAELVRWFQGVWEDGDEVPVSKLNAIAATLPEKRLPTPSLLAGSGTKRMAPLVKLAEAPIIHEYQGARGYYTGNGRQFCVLKDSIARGKVTNGFRANSNGGYDRLRDWLIEQGILSRLHDRENYRFTSDYLFSTSTPAASIVDGNSRTGPGCWKISRNRTR